MSHYFINDNELKSSPRLIKFNLLGQEILLKSDNGVFAKAKIDEGTSILIKTLALSKLDGRLLDLGSGYGIIGIAIAILNPNLIVTLSDVNLRALTLAKENVERLNLADRVNVIQSDLYQNIDEKFDVIASNPPIRAGKKVTYAIYEGAKSHLKDNGKLYIVIRKAQGEASTEAYLKTLYKSVKVLVKKHGYYVLEASN